jgi:hypothetical protein
MKNILNNIEISRYYFNFNLFNDISDELYIYLDDKLKNENYTSIWNLKNALTTNANGEYIL